MRIYGETFALRALTRDTFAVLEGPPASHRVRLVFDARAGTLAFYSKNELTDTLRHAVPVSLEEEGNGKYVGKYLSEELGVAWQVASESGVLGLQGHTFLREGWESLAPHVFTSGDVIFEFVLDVLGRVSELRVSASRVKDIRFLRLQLEDPHY